MSNNSYSATRTRCALVSRQAMAIAATEIRTYVRSFRHSRLPALLVARENALSKSFHVEALPDFGPWAIAYVDGRVVESPAFEAHSYRKIPGIKPRKLHVIRYSV